MTAEAIPFLKSLALLGDGEVSSVGWDAKLGAPLEGDQANQPPDAGI
jgi:hypothetical protein